MQETCMYEENSPNLCSSSSQTSWVIENVRTFGMLLLAWRDVSLGTTGLFFLLINFTPHFFLYLMAEVWPGRTSRVFKEQQRMGTKEDGTPLFHVYICVFLFRVLMGRENQPHSKLTQIQRINFKAMFTEH